MSKPMDDLTLRVGEDGHLLWSRSIGAKQIFWAPLLLSKCRSPGWPMLHRGYKGIRRDSAALGEV